MRTSRPRAAVVFTGFTLIVAACGGGSGPTKAEFAEDANAICSDLETSLASLGKSNPGNAQELTRTVAKLQSEVEDGISRLEDVERPSGADGEDAAAFVTALRKQIDEQISPAFDDLETAAQERDQKGLTAAVQKLQAIDSDRTNALAKKAGATGCAE